MPPTAVTVADLPVEPDALQAFALEQNRLARVLWEQLEILQHQIAQSNRARFGVSSERLAGQAELFDAATDSRHRPSRRRVPVAGHTRKGRPALPKDLPRTRIEYDLSDEQKMAFDTLERIGEERSETLHYEPSRLTVIEHIRFKYVAKKDGESTIVTASAQPSPLPKSNASASLLANVLVNTYVDHLPLNRQEMRYARRGVYLPRATLCEWKLAAAELLEVLLPPLARSPVEGAAHARGRHDAAFARARVARQRAQHDYGATWARASARRTASGSTTRRRSCSSSLSRARARIRCCT